MESGETGAARFNVSNFDEVIGCQGLLSCLGSRAATEVLKFGESRFLLALEVFDHISDGSEAVHSP